MMGRTLLVIGALATLGLVASAVLGFTMASRGGLDRHILAALMSCLLLLFSHTWIMFYLIGTGKAIKQAVAEHGLDGSLVEATKEYKNRSYPWLMAAMGMAMLTFILGGGVATRVLPAWLHQSLFYLTLLTQLRALVLEWQVLRDNERLMERVEHQADLG